MRWGAREEPLPHIRATHGRAEAQVFVTSLEVVTSHHRDEALGGRHLNELMPWMEYYEANLLYSWHLCSRGETPPKIPPPPAKRNKGYQPQSVPQWFKEMLEG